MSLGKTIFNIRESFGLSQSALARKAGLSNDYMHKIENDKVQNIGLEKIEAIANALEINPNELLKSYFDSRLLKFKSRLSDAEETIGELLKKNEFNFTKQEQEMVDLWRMLDAGQKKTVKALMKEFTKSHNKSQK